MSTKSTGSHFTVPDAPVAAFSPELESCYECLHRVITQSIQVPESIDTIIAIRRQLKLYYYEMRDLLEADFGISREVADALPEPEIAPFLKMLSAWESDLETCEAEYRARDIRMTAAPIYTDPAERFSGAAECWKQYRFWMFEADRMLRITRKRIAADAPVEEPRRYPWLQ